MDYKDSVKQCYTELILHLDFKLYNRIHTNFKGKHFWQFDDNSMMVVNLTPKRIGTHWMQCPKEIIRNPFEDNDYNTNLSKATAKFSIGEKTTWILLIFSFVMNTLFQRVLVPYTTAVVKTY